MIERYPLPADSLGCCTPWMALFGTCLAGSVGEAPYQQPNYNLPARKVASLGPRAHGAMGALPPFTNRWQHTLSLSPRGTE